MWVAGTLVLIYSVIWIALFRRVFTTPWLYPIAGSGWRTRTFWALTFFLFNPFLTLFFFLFGVLPKKATSRPAHLILMRSVCLGLIAFTLITFERPTLHPRNRVTTYTATDRDKSAGFIDAQISLLGNSTTHISGSGGFGGEWLDYLDLSHIAIINQGTHPFTAATGLRLAQHFNRSSRVETVTYYPKGEPAVETRLPGLIVEIHENSVQSTPLPAGTLIHAHLKIEIRTPQHFSSRWTALPLSALHAAVNIEESFITFGIASPSQKYTRAADKLLGDAGLLLTGGVLFRWQNYDLLPDIPEYAYGHGEGSLELPIPEGALNMKISGGEALTHAMTIWRFSAHGGVSNMTHHIKASMETEGWQTKKQTDDYLKMTRGSERLIIDHTESKSPTHLVRHINAFSPLETERTLERLLADDSVGTRTLTFFGRAFRDSKNEALQNAYAQRCHDLEPDSLATAIELGFANLLGNNPVRAEEMTRIARAHAGSASVPQAGWKIDELEETLNLSPAKDDSFDTALLEQAGFIPLLQENAVLTFTTALNEPLRFYAATPTTDDVNSVSNQFYLKTTSADDVNVRYFTFQIAEQLWPLEPAGWHFMQHHPSRMLNTMEYSPWGMSSYSKNAGILKDQVWQAEHTLQLNSGQLPIVLMQVNETDSGEFRWTFTPGESKNPLPFP